jgi:hypothetical protein
LYRFRLQICDYFSKQPSKSRRKNGKMENFKDWNVQARMEMWKYGRMERGVQNEGNCNQGALKSGHKLTVIATTTRCKSGVNRAQSQSRRAESATTISPGQRPGG